MIGKIAVVAGILVALAMTGVLKPKSQSEIAVDKMNDALAAIKEGDMMMACLYLKEAQMTFDMRVPDGKTKAKELAPAVNKVCNG